MEPPCRAQMSIGSIGLASLRRLLPCSKMKAIFHRPLSIGMSMFSYHDARSRLRMRLHGFRGAFGLRTVCQASKSAGWRMNCLEKTFPRFPDTPRIQAVSTIFHQEESAACPGGAVKASSSPWESRSYAILSGHRTVRLPGSIPWR